MTDATRTVAPIMPGAAVWVRPTRAEQRGAMADETIRQERVRKFLKTHAVLCALAFLMTSVETLMGVQPNLEAVIGSYLVSVVAGAMTFAGYMVYRRERLTNYVAPLILSIDSLLVLVHVFRERGMESGWAATPVLLTILMPLYSEDRRLMWGLAGLQVAVYLALFGLRAMDWIAYAPRPESAETWFYSTQGFVFVILGAAIFAGQASLDVLNSQKRLQDEVEQATAALKRAQAQLVQQAKMAGLGQLTAGVAHEINNPLTFVQTNLTSIERDMRDVFELVQSVEPALPALEKADPAAAARFLEMRDEIGFDEEMIEMLGELMDDARDGLARVQRIIADLRTFSRAGSAELRPIDLGKAIEQAIQQFEKECAEPVVLEHAVRGPVKAYPLLLNQVLINLLRNACDAVPDGSGRITIRTHPHETSGVHIEVVDNGSGVPRDIRERIFEPFFTTKEVGQGTGLGLAISYQIVEHHQGRIEVDDAPDGGAVFRIWLPDKRTEAA